MKKQYKILIADDSEIIRDSFVQMLTEHSEHEYILYLAKNGIEACSLAFKEKPDLILIDIEMPVMDGIKAIKKIKSNTLLDHIPIIVISATRLFQEAINAGANDFIIKPFNKFELLLRVQQNLMLSEEDKQIKRQQELFKLQRHEAIIQRDTILKQKSDLIDDLKYARAIQKAILPNEEAISEYFKEFFIYDNPKNIVSGDFYWITKKEELIIIAVADCTGHGLSGALMTMAGATFLNEIIAKTAELHSDQILNELRFRIIEFLKQKGKIGEVANGMDISLVIYNETNGSIQFSGAYNPLYIVKEGQPLEVIKGDRMPIGFYYDKEHPFTKNETKVSKGDTIYMFSDGYSDQFGGETGKKFRYGPFQELLSQASLLSVNEQHQLLKETMEKWIEGHDQVDDMLILGIKL